MGSSQKPIGISSWKAFGYLRHWAWARYPGSENSYLTVSQPSLCSFVKHFVRGELTLTPLHREQKRADVSKSTWQINDKNTKSRRGLSFTDHVWAKKKKKKSGKQNIKCMKGNKSTSVCKIVFIGSLNCDCSCCCLSL